MIYKVFFFEKNTFLENQKTDFSEKLKNEVFEILDQFFPTKLTEAPPRGWGVFGQNFSHKPMFHLFAFP